eukprot:5693675-Lingulodinium_polyedra.AAC.1
MLAHGAPGFCERIQMGGSLSNASVLHPSSAGTQPPPDAMPWFPANASGNLSVSLRRPNANCVIYRLAS